MADMDSYALALSSLAASAVSDYKSYKYSKQLAEHQLELNKQQFQYQSQLQRQYQQFLWQNQGAAQVQSYKQAGLNPAGVSSSVVGASLPSLSPVGSSPQYSRSDSVGNAMRALAASKELKMMDSEIKLREAQARNLNSDADYKDLQVNSFADTLKASLGLMDSQSYYYSQQGDKVDFEIDQIEQNIDESASRIKVNNKLVELHDAQIKETIAYAEEANARIKYLPEHLKVELAQAAAAQLQARAAMKAAGAQEASANAAMLSARTGKELAKSQISVNDAHKMQIEADRKLTEVNQKLRDRYGDAEEIVGMFGTFVGSVGSSMLGIGALGTAGAALKRLGSAPAVVKGFGK